MSNGSKGRLLRDRDIKSHRPVGRRRLLTGLAVLGTGLAAAGCQTGAFPAAATGTTDSDTGAAADPIGGGRGYCRTRTSGATDADRNAITDPVGNGRGGSGQRRTGVTDADTAASADPIGLGRGRGRAAASGVTDRDAGGACTDPFGNGRNA